MQTEKSEPIRPFFSIILARSENKVIGCEGKIPWDCPEDMQYFKSLTTGHICLSGYKTYLSMPENGLPDRKLYVLTSKKLKNKKSVFFIQSFEEFLDLTKNTTKEIFCIGGLAVYKIFIPFASKIYLTEIKGIYEGDVFFDDNLLLGFKPKLLNETKTCKYYLYKREGVGR
ncbi:MAG: dihydrofolate reductase [Treponemataceae bacterium]